MSKAKLSKIVEHMKDLCYLDPQSKKYNVCDSKGKYDCKKLQSVYNQALKSGNKVVSGRAIELKKILNCKWEKEKMIPIESEKRNHRVPLSKSAYEKRMKTRREHGLSRNPRIGIGKLIGQYTVKEDKNLVYNVYETLKSTPRNRHYEVTVKDRTGEYRIGYTSDYMAMIKEASKGYTISKTRSFIGRLRNPAAPPSTTETIFHRRIKPTSPRERRRVYEKFGPECFLDPKGQRYPICDKNTGRLDCTLLLSAYRYANQYERDLPLAKKAIRIAGDNNCEWAEKYRHNPEVGDVWQLESKSEIEASDYLNFLSERAINGDRKARKRLEEIFEERWEYIKPKLETEGSAWVVWWQDGVRYLMLETALQNFGLPHSTEKKILREWQRGAKGTDIGFANYKTWEEIIQEAK